MPVGVERKREGLGLLPRGRVSTGTFVPRVFKGWAFRGGLSRESHQFFYMCIFKVVVSTDWSAPGKGPLVLAAGPGGAWLVLLLFWVWS